MTENAAQIANTDETAKVEPDEMMILHRMLTQSSELNVLNQFEMMPWAKSRVVSPFTVFVQNLIEGMKPKMLLEGVMKELYRNQALKIGIFPQYMVTLWPTVKFPTTKEQFQEVDLDVVRNAFINIRVVDTMPKKLRVPTFVELVRQAWNKFVAIQVEEEEKKEVEKKDEPAASKFADWDGTGPFPCMFDVMMTVRTEYSVENGNRTKHLLHQSALISEVYGTKGLHVVTMVGLIGTHQRLLYNFSSNVVSLPETDDPVEDVPTEVEKSSPEPSQSSE